jgi:exo-beta-1,3-glucanase (GH17 family)
LALPQVLSTPLTHPLLAATGASAISTQAAAAPAAAAPAVIAAHPVMGIITVIKQAVVAVLDDAINCVNQLPANPVTNFLESTLLLVRRFFTNVPLVSPAVGLDFSLSLASNPPSYTDAVNVIKNLGVTSIRMYNINPQALDAIKAQIPNANVTVEISNQEVTNLATNPAYATTVLSTLKPWDSIVKTVVVGNEVDAVPASEFTLPTVTQAVINMQNAIAAEKLPIAVTCSFTYNIIANSYPPSSSVLANMTGLTDLLKQLHNYAEIDIYPLLVLDAQPADVPLDYALGEAKNPVYDPVSGVSYNSLFWAQYDGAMWAFQKAGIDLPLQVGETGWATNSVQGSPFATVQNAQTYNQNLFTSLATTGSPAFGVKNFPTYLFEFADENQKPGGSFENYFGWYAIIDGILQQKYPLNLPV